MVSLSMKIICVRGYSIRAFFSAHKVSMSKWCWLGCAADSWSWASRASQGPEAPRPPSVHSRMNKEAARVMLRGVAFAFVPFEEEQGNASTAGKRPNDELGCWEDGAGLSKHHQELLGAFTPLDALAIAAL